MEISQLRALQERFESERANSQEAIQLYKTFEDLTSQFQEKFNRNRLFSMTLQDYVVGNKNKDSFCYWLQYKTSDVGEIFVGGAGLSFGVYFSKSDNTYKVPEGYKSKAVSEEDAIKEMERIKKGLIELLSLAERENFSEMSRISKILPLDQQVVGKILTLYFPERYLGVFSNAHLNEFLDTFELLDSKTRDLNIFERRSILLAFKSNDEIMKNWTNRKYVDFLYKTILKNQKISSTSVSRADIAYFILRTGGGEYSDQPELRYNFKKGIPGYKLLMEAASNARFVYLENGVFYGKGRIGDIKSNEKDGVTHFFAQILDYEKIEPLRIKEVSNKLSRTLTQEGIMKISEEDYRILVGFQHEIVPQYTIEDFVRETGFEKTRIQSWVQLLIRKKQIIFQGPPGTGKTFLALRLAKLFSSEKSGLVEVVQFHPDYSYEDFIQGYFPEPKSGFLQFTLKKGRFLDFCDRARNQANGAPCVMIIDEINRAKLARVFGELMYLLEYRDLEIPLAAGGKPFRIPENIFIIGTMNTADRSIALVDHALRRRFSFVRLQPEYDVMRGYLVKHNLPAESLISVLKEINRAIEDQNYAIGISFFMKDQQQLRQMLPIIWKTEIEPYLEEYFYDQSSKVESFRWDNLVKDSLKDWMIP